MVRHYYPGSLAGEGFFENLAANTFGLTKDNIAAQGVIQGNLLLTTGVTDLKVYGFDFGTHAWSTLPARPDDAYYMASVTTGSKWLLFGGCTNADHTKASNAVSIFDATTKTWTTGAPMPVAVCDASAAIIGQIVYVCGGKRSALATNAGLFVPLQGTCQRYNLATNTWSTSTSAMPQGVIGGATSTDGVSLFVMGGKMKDDGSSTEVRERLVQVYTVSTNSWVKYTNMIPGRSDFNCQFHTTLKEIICAGGVSSASHNSTENGWFDYYGIDPLSEGGKLYQRVDAYNPVTNMWRRMRDMPEGAAGIGLSQVGNSLYTVGQGPSGSNFFLKFNVNTSPAVLSTWEKASADIPSSLGISEVASGIVVNAQSEEVMITFGRDDDTHTFGYNIASKMWTDTYATRPYVGNHQSAEVYNNRIIVLGGCPTPLAEQISGPRDDVALGNTIQTFDIISNSWVKATTKLPKSLCSTNTAIIGDFMYVAAGNDNTLGNILKPGSFSTYRFNLVDFAKTGYKTAVFETLANIPVAVNHAASATDGKLMYVFAGRDFKNRANPGANTVQVYDPVSNKWSCAGSFVAGGTPGCPQGTTNFNLDVPVPLARGGMGKAVFANGLFYIMGGELLGTGEVNTLLDFVDYSHNVIGETDGNVVNRVDVYDPVKKEWHSGPTMPIAMHGIYPVYSKTTGKIYIGGGGDTSGGTWHFSKWFMILS